MLHLIIVIQSALALAPLITCQQTVAQNESLQQEKPTSSMEKLDNNTTQLILLATTSYANESSASTTNSNFSSSTTIEPLTVVSPSEQLHENSSSNLNSTTYYYGSPEDEPSKAIREDNSEGGSDLNFSLMNAPHERIQAVQNLLNSQNIINNSNKQTQDDNRPQQYASYQFNSLVAQPANSMQCTHKGRQYLHGQTVLIEEQPCLNCTCRRAVLQCFLRVCPPIISLEAQRRMQQIVSMEIGGIPQRCRMAKEPAQCCPSLRCEPEVARPTTNNSSSNSATGDGNRKPHSHASSTHSHDQPANSDASIVSLTDNETTSAAATTTSSTRIKTTKEDTTGSRNNSQQNRSSSAEKLEPSSTTMASVANNEDTDHLPKLTVINGASGQRDSILLITSNPNSHHAINMSEKSSASAQNGSSSSSSIQRQDYAHALMEALLETVYSSAAQLNGLNLQGSCMINGSLYVEGSAVIPEGSAICQYCYCIRQKIMCVRPKCHLIISGCSPKYSNEYACCPTSYSCSNSDYPSTSALSLNSSQARQLPARLSLLDNSSGLLNNNNQQSLTSKLWAALESISSQMQQSSAQTQKLDNSAAAVGQVIPRQVDSTRSLNHHQESSPINPATMLALMNSAGKFTSTDSTSAGNETHNESNVTTSTTPATTTTSTGTSTSVQPTDSSSNGLNEARTRGGDSENSEVDLDNNNDDEDDDEGMKQNNESGSPISSTSGENSPVPHEFAMRQQQFQSTTEQPSSVSDFLEPMIKLGPLVVSPSAPSGCLENNRQYAIGEQIPTLESCKHCYCGAEGLKECKKIDCGLKIAHNCRPIIPEGHCCPIRYECPPSGNNNNTNPQSQDSRGRYRSEETSGEPSSTSTALPFSGTTQCKIEGNGDDDANCQEIKITTTSTSTTTSQPEVALSTLGGSSEEDHHTEQNIRTLRESDVPVPVFKSTRVIGSSDGEVSSLFPPTTHKEILPPAAEPIYTTIASNFSENLTDFNFRIKNSTGVEGSGASLNLTEELNKFIMQIKQSSSTTTQQPLSQPKDYSIVSVPQQQQQQQVFDSSINETSQEMMINNQRLRMSDYSPQTTTTNTDYHSVQVEGTGGARDAHSPADDELFSSPSPPVAPSVVIPAGMIGIPSVRVEPMNDIPIPIPFPTAVPNILAATNNSLQENTISENDQNLPSQRDSRSTMMDQGNAMSSNDNNNNNNLHISFNADLVQSSPPSSEPAAVTLNPDYYVDNNQNNGAENGRTGANLTANIGFDQSPNEQPRAQPVGNNETMVVFDDDENTTSTGGSNSRVAPDNVFITHQNSSSPNSAQVDTTTGTPIGLEADRSGETSGWLQSISGVVRSFGRRFSGATATNQKQGRSNSDLLADSATGSNQRVNNNNNNNSSIIRDLSPGEKAPIGQETARSRSSSSSLLDQLFKSVIGNLDGENNNEQHKPELVMRPLLPGSEAAQTPADKQPVIQEQPVEIVTAVEANEPEIFTQPSAQPQQQVDKQSDQFLKRSGDVIDDDLMSMASTTSTTTTTTIASAAPRYLASAPSTFFDSTNNLNNNLPAFRQLPVGGNFVMNQRLTPLGGRNQATPIKVLTCYDSATNRTYQPNEIIPKNDPCKTCTCLLGEELCQTLKCPEKPAENCSEERRVGECCANYLCGNNVSQYAANAPTMESIRNSQNGFTNRESGRLTSVLATQRAMNVDSVFGNQQANGLQTHQRPMMNPIQTSMSNNRARPMPTIDSSTQQQQQQQQRQRQQLPQHPIRTSDLANLLPPHLRFRPNNSIQSASVNLMQPPNQAGGNLLSNNQQQVDRSKVLFTGQQRATNNEMDHQHRNSQPTGVIASNPLMMSQFLNSAPNNWGQFKPQRTPVSPLQLIHPQQQRLANQLNRNNEDQFLLRRTPTNQPTTQSSPRVPQVVATSGSGSFPQNVLMSRMSGQQLPISSSSPSDINQLRPSIEPTNNWLPNNGPIHSSTSAPLIFKQSPEVDKIQKLESIVKETSPIEPAEQRVLFQQTPTINSNTVDTGFRPISLSQEAQQSTTVNGVEATTFASANSSNLPLSSSSTTTVKFEDSSSSAPETPPNQLVSLPEQPANVKDLVELKSSTETTTKATEMKAVEISLTTERPEESSSTTIATITSTEPSSSTSIDNDSGKIEPEEDSDQKQETISSDLPDMFKVSECNIYGRIYKVGQSIEELSDVCKQCTCTQMGVDCKRKC